MISFIDVKSLTLSVSSAVSAAPLTIPFLHFNQDFLFSSWIFAEHEYFITSAQREQDTLHHFGKD